MARTESSMAPLGSDAPLFSLPDTDGKVVTLSHFEGRPLLVMFICNHCPFVKHVRSELAAIGRDYTELGVAVVAINANDAEKYPEDSPQKMAAEKREQGYTFPYLFDESQSVAKAYQATCTPDFFVFDSGHHLFYRGQLDDSRPGSSIPVTGKDLRAALDAVVKGLPRPSVQRPSMGCNIKWR